MRAILTQRSLSARKEDWGKMCGGGGRRRASGATIAVSLMVLATVLPFVPSVAADNSTFAVLSATWSSTSVVAGPGSINVPLTVAIEYKGGSTATSVAATLQLPQGFTDTSGSSSPTTGAVSVSSYTIFHLKYNLTIASSVAVGTYSASITFLWTTNAGGSQVLNSETDTVTVNLLGTVQMSASASQATLNAGEVNNVTITLTNRGTGTATRINPTLSASVGSVLTVLPSVASLAGGSSVSFSVRVYVPSSYAGDAVTLTLASTYIDAYGASGSSSLSIGFYALTVPEPVLSFTASSESLTPGQVNEIVVTMTNDGPGTVSSVKTTVSASGVAGSQSSGSGFFSILSQFPQVAKLPAGKSVNATIRLFAPSSAAGAAATLTFAVSFTDPYGYSQTTTQSIGLYTASSTAIAAATSLSVATSSNSLTAGLKSSVAFVIKNTGQQPVYSPTISLTTSTPLVVSVNSTVTLAGAVINPGSTLAYSAEVTTGTSATGGFYAGTLTITFNDQFGDSHTQTVPVAFIVTIPISQVSVASVASQIGVGRTSSVSFMITNSGTAPVYSPSFSLTVPTGLAVTSNATFSRSGLIIEPGKSVKYVANVTSGPKTAEGAYIATLAVSYADQFGNARTSTFSVGLVAIGGIQMVVQNQKFSHNGTSVTVTGTLLNEGLANAYYTQVTGTLTSGITQLATASSYVGEVDSNTPLPVSLGMTIPASALSSTNGTAVLTLTASYQNDFGQSLQFKTTQRVQLSGGASSGGSSGLSSNGQGAVSAQTLELIRYGALVGILAAAVATVIYVRRGRSRRSKASAKSDVY